MRIIKQGGEIANTNGKSLEATIRNLLLEKGYVELTKSENEFVVKHGGTHPSGWDSPDKWFTTQIPLTRNLYGARWRSDFYIVGQGYPNGILVEVKWQGSGGSVDEKYVFTVESMISADIEAFKIFLLCGIGVRQGARDWIKKRIKSANAKKPHVKFMQSIDEFMHWANKEL